MKRIFSSCLALLLMLATGMTARALGIASQKDQPDDPRYGVSWSGLQFRSLGPALTSGRISDFAVNPDDPSEFYVATASGGVWKTTNMGADFKPVFDHEGSYSIGAITMDPNNHNVIWVGTGENNNQRSVSYGDGLYKSVDGGKSWTKVGLDHSEHIGMIAVDPRNSDVVYVAAYGPLWSAGGDRGLYKTTDGGKTWNAVLTISENTGVNEVHLDPRNPDVVYATAHQRRRKQFTLIDGGPESAVYKSTDGGQNWRKIMKGLPGGWIGRIGMDISPANPDVLYAIVEAQGDHGGFFRSTDRGESWQKMDSYTSRGNYYQEIIADPVDVNRVYSMDTFAKVTEDGGKTWQNLGEKNKHVDNHALWINPENPKYLLIGCDGGVYQSYDRGNNWRFYPNLPVTQFYKVSVDYAQPFYNVYGGTQDNFSLGGPTRTIDATGISNSNWFVTVRGDGFETQVDPKDSDIIYAQSQYGNVVRFDRKTGEQLSIKPKAPKGEDAYNFNWDTPLLISSHDHQRLYIAADKVFRSDDRGNSWKVISGDMTRQIDRNKLEVMGRVWPMDAVAKNASTSKYGAVVALEESPVDENLLFAGTDDGLVHITEDGGQNWRTIDHFPGAPDRIYVNEIIASHHDRNTVYVALNNHKSGDFKPYIYKSTDLGRSWKPIANNLPERGSVYAIAEDYKNPDLLFVGTEYSLFVSLDGGQSWKKFNNGLPTVAVRDITIQPREDDLVLATFGRGFYVLDNYSALREFSKPVQQAEGHLFSVRDSYQYLPYSRIGASASSVYYGKKGFQGETWFLGENLKPGALITYYLKDTIQTLKEQRQEQEKKKFKDDEPVYYPSYEELSKERDEKQPYLLFTIRDMNNEVVRELRKPATKGLHRVRWDLRFPDITSVSESDADPLKSSDDGILVLPGTYTVQMSKSVDGKVTPISDPVSFTVKPLEERSIPTDRDKVLAFQHRLMELARTLNGAERTVDQLEERAKYYLAAVKVLNTPEADSLKDDIYALQDQLEKVREKLSGDPVAAELDMDQPPSISDRINGALYGNLGSTAKPTETQQRVSEIATERIKPVLQQLQNLQEQDVPRIEQQLDKLHAPWTPGRTLKLQDQ